MEENKTLNITLNSNDSYTSQVTSVETITGMTVYGEVCATTTTVIQNIISVTTELSLSAVTATVSSGATEGKIQLTRKNISGNIIITKEGDVWFDSGHTQTTLTISDTAETQQISIYFDSNSSTSRTFKFNARGTDIYEAEKTSSCQITQQQNGNTTSVILNLSKNTNDDTDYTFNSKLSSTNWVGQTITNNTGSTNKTSKTLTFNVPVIYTGDTFTYNFTLLNTSASFDYLAFGGAQMNGLKTTTIDNLNSALSNLSFNNLNSCTLTVGKNYDTFVTSYINVSYNTSADRYWHNFIIMNNDITYPGVSFNGNEIYEGTSEFTYKIGTDLNTEKTFYIGGGIGDVGNYKYYKMRVIDSDGTLVFDDSTEKLYHTSSTKTGVKMTLRQFIHSTWYLRDSTKD